MMAMFKSSGSRPKLNPFRQRQQLVPVGEAGHHVQLLAPIRLQRLDGLGHGIAADDLLPGDLRIVEAHGQVVDVLPAENDLFTCARFSCPKSMSHSQLVSPVKYFRLMASTMMST